MSRNRPLPRIALIQLGRTTLMDARLPLMNAMFGRGRCAAGIKIRAGRNGRTARAAAIKRTECNAFGVDRSALWQQAQRDERGRKKRESRTIGHLKYYKKARCFAKVSKDLYCVQILIKYFCISGD